MGLAHFVCFSIDRWMFRLTLPWALMFHMFLFCWVYSGVELLGQWAGTHLTTELHPQSEATYPIVESKGSRSSPSSTFTLFKREFVLYMNMKCYCDFDLHFLDSNVKCLFCKNCFGHFFCHFVGFIFSRYKSYMESMFSNTFFSVFKMFPFISCVLLICAWVCACNGSPVKVRGLLTEVGSLFLLVCPWDSLLALLWGSFVVVLFYFTLFFLNGVI